MADPEVDLDAVIERLLEGSSDSLYKTRPRSTADVKRLHS
jgi:hypothetical protein